MVMETVAQISPICRIVWIRRNMMRNRNKAYFQSCERFVSPCKEYGNGSPFHYSMDTAISGMSVYYGYTTIITGDNRYIVVPQAASSGKSIVL